MRIEESAGKPPNILYVDDEFAMRDSFKQFMELQFDIKVTVVSSPDEAIEAMGREEFDAIVSDYQMPEVDGIQFLKELRKSSSIPFILFTGKGREEIVIEALNSGADYYMQKGGNPIALFAELHHYIILAVERKRREEQLALANERMESIIRNTSDAFAFFDLDGKIVSVNNAFEKIYGWSAEEAIGKGLLMVPPDCIDEAKGKFQELLTTRKTVSYIGRRMRKNGELFEMSMTITPVKNSKGEIIGIAGIGRDVTELTRALEINARQREELKVTIASIGDGVIATDTHGRITVINGIASKLTGYTEEEAIGRPVNEIFNIINEETRKKVSIPVEIVMLKGEIVGLANHTVLISKNGREYMIEDSAAPIKDHSGKISGIVMVFKDATEEKLTERRRRTRYAVSLALATEKSMEGAFKSIAENVCSQLNFQSGEIWLLSPEDGRIHLETRVPADKGSGSDHGETSVKADPESAAGLLITVYRTGKPLWISDLTADQPGVVVNEAKPADARSAFGVPLSNKGKVEGAMLFFSSSQLDADRNTLNTMEDIGKQIGLFIGRIRVEEELKTLLHNLESFIMNTPLVIIASKIDGTIVSVNNAFEATYGWKREEIVGKSVDCIVPPELRQDVKEKLKAVSSGSSFTYEAARLRKDGTRIYMRITASPVVDSKGRVISMSSIARDITKERLADAENRLNHEVMENLKEMVVISELNDINEPVVKYVNSAYVRTIGYSRNEVIGKTLWDLQGDAVDSASLNRMYASYISGTPYSGEVVSYGTDGKEIILDTNFFPMKNSTDGAVVWVLIQKDITDSALYRENLKKINDKLNLMETISRHDMMNHIQAIEAYTRMVVDSTVDKGLSERTDRIIGITERMRTQLQTLKELQFSGSPRWTDPKKTFMGCIESMDLGRIGVSTTGPDVEILADPLLERAFSNLIVNTTKHGGPVRSIALNVSVKDNYLLIVYSDDGRGIPDSMKESIFSGGMDRQPHGLKLVSDVLKITNISISEKGTQGKGAVFEFKVPSGSYRFIDLETEKRSGLEN